MQQRPQRGLRAVPDRLRASSTRYAQTDSVQVALVYGLENTVGIITEQAVLAVLDLRSSDPVAVIVAFAVSNPIPTRELGVGRLSSSSMQPGREHQDHLLDPFNEASIRFAAGAPSSSAPDPDEVVGSLAGQDNCPSSERSPPSVCPTSATSTDERSRRQAWRSWVRPSNEPLLGSEGPNGTPPPTRILILSKGLS
jgi:hypothetical protein